jgi:hypothetical protein
MYYISCSPPLNNIASIRAETVHIHTSQVIVIIWCIKTPKGVSTLSWLWDLRDSVTWRAMPAVV